MKVYRFFESKWALQAIRDKQLKISRYEELNDPFELFALDFSDRNVRQAFASIKNYFRENRGLICFSETWQNPLMWSHYGDKHKGICLGFEVNPQFLTKMNYSSRRLKNEIEALMHSEDEIAENSMQRCIQTKFSHWSYEKEHRIYTDLKDAASSGHYFIDFSEDMKLTSVIVGPKSEVKRADLESVLRAANFDLKPDYFKTRLAFQSFRVIRNEKESLWQ